MRRIRPDIESSILLDIVRKKLEAVPTTRFAAPPSDRSFVQALKSPGLSLIAEIKRRSPSRGELRPGLDPAAIAEIYDGRASAISVLTDGPFFGGQLEDLRTVRRASRCPILAKDFVVDDLQIEEARAYGADAVLLIAAVLAPRDIEACLERCKALSMAALVEVHDEAELEAVLTETSAEIVGVNSRDLKTMKMYPERLFKLLPEIRRAGKVAVAESGLESKDQLEALASVADAVLIGSSLMAAPDIGAKLTELGW